MMTSLLAGGPALTRRAGLAVASLALLLAAAGPLRAEDAKDPLVAKVDGVEIHQSDLAIAEEAAGQIPPMPPDAKRDYLVQFMADLILVSKAAEDKKIGDSAAFKQQLEFDRRKLLMADLLDQVGKSALTDEAMHKVYDEAVKQIGEQPEVHARHILIRVEAGDAKASDAAKAKIEAVIARLNKGEDFATVAKEVTEDPSGKTNGGDLGYFTKEQMVPEFADVAFKLDKGQISGPVKTQFGWHVIKVEDKRVKPPPTFDEVLLVVGFAIAGAQRSMADLDRIRSARQGDDGRGTAGTGEMRGEPVGLDRRRRDDHLEVGPPLEQAPEVSQQEIDVEAALVRLVDDDRVVAREVAVALRLREQDAIGHQLDVGVGSRPVGEADLVADGLAGARPELLRDPCRDGTRGDAPRLRMADQPPFAASRREADLRQLRRLARAGLAAHDDDRMLANRGRDVVGALRDGQLRRIDDRRLRRGARTAQRDRALDVLADPPPLLRPDLVVTRALDPRAQPRRVGRHRIARARQQTLAARHYGDAATGGSRRSRRVNHTATAIVAIASSAKGAHTADCAALTAPPISTTVAA